MADNRPRRIIIAPVPVYAGIVIVNSLNECFPQAFCCYCGRIIVTELRQFQVRRVVFIPNSNTFSANLFSRDRGHKGHYWYLNCTDSELSCCRDDFNCPCRGRDHRPPDRHQGVSNHGSALDSDVVPCDDV